MKKTVKLNLPPQIAFDEAALHRYVAEDQALDEKKMVLRLLRRSADARKKQIKINIEVEIYIDELPESPISYQKNYPDVRKAEPVLVVGAGPAGMFAALRLIELGLRPVILERGKDVQSRRHDLAAITRRHEVDTDSNYCFGEGGAGTYSDGKLYTRAKKRGDFRRVLEIFFAHGAPENILFEAKPHIGTNKLPKIIAEIRQSILDAGGEVHFESRVTDFILRDNQFHGLETAGGERFEARNCILATGHSARDIFYLLDRKKILIENKPFALGVRVEHPQALIDKIQYGTSKRGLLPAAAYSLVQQVGPAAAQKGVFSFCMCPGGFIVPAATAPGEVVVNGMSPSRRDSFFANSGIVTQIDEEDLADFRKFGALAGLEFQKSIEQKACEAAGNRQTAPAQRLADFCRNNASSTLNESSYVPGLASVRTDEILPPALTFRLREGFKAFDKKMHGFLTNDAQIAGVESRTSSPVRIPRDKIRLEHPQIAGLFPCGEGAGYAGGIASAAMDGERCAERIAEIYFGKKVE